MVICLERDADLHMPQLMPLPLTVSCFSKIQMVLPFCYRLTWVVPEKGPLNGCSYVILYTLFSVNLWFFKHIQNGWTELWCICSHFLLYFTKNSYQSAAISWYFIASSSPLCGHISGWQHWVQFGDYTLCATFHSVVNRYIFFMLMMSLQYGYITPNNLLQFLKNG